MIRVAITSVCLLLSLPVATSFAQKAPTASAVDEAVRRQANTILLGQRLAEARAAEAKKDIEAAARLYEQAYQLAQDIGASVATERQQAVSGLVAVRLELARQAQKSGDLREAKLHLDRAFAVDPQNPQVIEARNANEQAFEAMRGRMPSEELLARVPDIKEAKVQNSILVQDGVLLYEMGKLDEAEAKLKQAVEEDPENRAAAYYLSLIKEARYLDLRKKREAVSKESLVEVTEAWERPTKREALAVPNPYARTNLVYVGKGRQAIISKLERIHLDEVFYDGLPLGEVVRNLSEEAKKRDPDKRGINIIISPYADPQTVAAPAAGAIDPNTGLPVATFAPPEPVEMGSIAIKLNPALNDVRLADVLDAIVKVSETPIKYSIEEYAVVFTFKAQEIPPLHTRWFKVDPNTFQQGLESVGGFVFGDIETGTGGTGGGGRGGGGRSGGSGQGDVGLVVPRVNVAAGAISGGGGAGGAGGGTGQAGEGLASVTRTNNMEVVLTAARQFFTAAGVDLTPPKAIFFNDREGRLLVRATLEDLDIIQAAIQVLNVAPPMISIEAKFVEITQEDTRSLGFDWFLGNVAIKGGDILASGGTQPSFSGAPSTANPGGTFPGNQDFDTASPPSLSDGSITSGLRNNVNAPAVASLTGILTDPQFKVVIRALEQRGGADLLAAPAVTTLSGRQAQIQTVDIQTVVTAPDLSQTSTGGGTGLVDSGGGGAIGSVIQYQVEPLPFGPVLDVIPYVSADGYTIQMTIIPTVTEFIGYDDPGQFIPQAQSVSGGAGGVALPLVAQLPLPRLRMRQVTTSAIVWDGQTIALGGLISEDVQKIKDKVPVLGDLPIFGRFFRSESASTRKKNLMIFVTPTIIDPAGNRVNLPEDLPFAQVSVPPQTGNVPNP